MDLLDRKHAAKFAEHICSTLSEHSLSLQDGTPRYYIRGYSTLFASMSLPLFRLRIRDDMADAT